MSDRMKVKVSELIIDEKLTRLRPINEVFVSRYRQAYRAGKDLGEIIVDTANRIVSGNHRVTAMMQEFGLDYETTVTVKKYDNEREVLEDFARHNSDHGNALSGASQRAISIELIKSGASKEEIAQLFGVSVNRVEKWSGITVMVIGGKNGKTRHPQPMPAKNGVAPGTTMEREQYETHWKQDRGISAVSQAAQLCRWIDNGWITDAKSIAALQLLSDVINKHFPAEEGVA